MRSRTPSSSFVLATLASLGLLAGAAVGQEAMQPPSQLQKLEGLIGTWEGSGTVTDSGGSQSEWTSKSSIRKVLGGQFLRKDMRVDLGENMPALAFVTYYGWDSDNDRYITLETGNMGTVTLSELHVSAGTMTHTVPMTEEGQPVVDYWVDDVKGDTVTITDYRMMGGAEPFAHVQGTSKRTSTEPSDIDLPEELFAFASADSSKTAPLAKMAGTYQVDGWMIQEPGAPKTNITGTETIRPRWSDSVLSWHTTGTAEGSPMQYEGVGFMGWDAGKQRYTMAFLSNLGEIGHSDGWLTDGKLVFTDAGLMHGMPIASRSTMALNDDGTVAHSSATMIIGTGKPIDAFEAKYQRTGDAEPVEASSKKSK